MTPAQLADLKDEINSDPLTLGYAGKGHEQIAELLAKRTRLANRTTLDAGLLVASIVRSEYVALSASDKDYLRLVVAAQSMPLTNTLKAELGAIFPAGSQTRVNLIAILKRSGTRAEELLIPQPTTSDVANALAS